MSLIIKVLVFIYVTTVVTECVMIDKGVNQIDTQSKYTSFVTFQQVAMHFHNSI